MAVKFINNSLTPRNAQAIVCELVKAVDYIKAEMVNGAVSLDGSGDGYKIRAVYQRHNDTVAAYAYDDVGMLVGIEQ